jgi:MFS family permease
MSNSPTVTIAPSSVTRSRPAASPLIPRGVHPYAWWSLFATWAIWVINAMDVGFIQVLGPSIVKEFKIDAATMGGYISAIFLLRVFVDLPAAWLSDRVGGGWRRKLVWAPIIVFYAVCSTLSAVHALSATVGLFFLLRAAVNAGSVACETISVSATAEWWSQQNRGFAVGLHHTGYPVGSFLAGQVVAFVLSTYGDAHWRHAFWFSALSLPFVALYWWLSRHDRFDAVQRAIVRAGEQPCTADPERDAADRAPLRSVLGNREIVLAALYPALAVSAYFMFAISYPLYLAFVGGYSFAEVASYSVVWALTAAVFQFLLPSLSDRIGRKPILVFAGFYAGAVLLLLPHATSGFMVFLVQILYGVVLSAIYPLCFAVCADAAPRGRMATAISLSTTLLWGAAAASVYFTGHLIDLGGGFQSAEGYRLVFKLMSALSFASGALFLFARETAPQVLARRASTTIAPLQTQRGPSSPS